MSLDNYIPAIWAAALLENLNDKHVYASCYNHDFEGDISSVGDSVRINTIGRVTIGTYTKNSTTITAETLDDAQQTLMITESKYFAFEIDDIDKVQQKPKAMGNAMLEAAWGLADTADAFLATQLTASVASGNLLTAATSVGTGATDNDAYEILVDLGVKLDENNAGEDRWVVIPPWFHGMLLKDPRFVSFGTPENRKSIRNGSVGQTINGFTVKVSNNVPVSGSAYDVLAGYTGAATFAEQIPEGSPEAYRPEGAFSDALKGLHLYGAKITRPNALSKIVATSA